MSGRLLDGNIHPDYADVASCLIRQIPKNQHGGSAVCVYHEGHKVVDIWGGSKDKQGSPWAEDTTAPSFSTTKGVMSTLVHILVDQGLAKYSDPVAKFWPEFAARGKQNITIQQALSHEAGLYRLSEMIDSPQEMLDWDHMKGVIADAVPAHQPGEQHGYHAVTYGWLIGGLIEAITGKPLQSVLQDELVDPLQLDGLFIGMPHNELFRRAKLINNDGLMRGTKTSTPGEREDIRGVLGDWAEYLLEKAGLELSEFRSALRLSEDFDWNAEETVQAIIPAANGQFTARSLARMYAMLANGGELDGVRLLSREVVQNISATRGMGRDKVLFLPMQWRLGYHKVFALGVSAPSAFGHYGYGGSGAFCDPQRNLAVALTLNSGVGTPMGDSRMPRMARAAIKAVDRINPTKMK